MRLTLYSLIPLLSLWSLGALEARPNAPQALCEQWASEGCSPTQQTDCSPCHTLPPARDRFGAAIEELHWPGDERPESDEAFLEGLTSALSTLAGRDSDGDGVENRAEWLAGSDPGDASVVPQTEERDPCAAGGANPDYDVCGYDFAYAYKRVMLDFCGAPPSWPELQAMLSQTLEGRHEALHEALDRCLSARYWLGRDGALWRLAHPKVRPIGALKSGEDAGPIPLGDYEPDYALFAYAMSGDRDVRDLLMADYFVRLTREDPPRYERAEALPGQLLPAERRAGLISSRWFLLINTMFTPVPRTTAAQAYRAYLGLDIAKSEGLINPPDEAGELIDYDEKGITAPACAACHVTLDPLSYPFSRFEGIAGPQTGAYRAGRLEGYGAEEGAQLSSLPEAGYLLGRPVQDLGEWAEVAANSDAFAQKVTLDLWTLLIGEAPHSERDLTEFEALWTGLMGADNYRVEATLHALIDTLAYGRP